MVGTALNGLARAGLRRPRLLVSVRSAEEALQAAEGGAAIIDVKEPNRGSLGMADVSQIAEVARVLAAHDPQISVSAALGEVRDWGETRGLPKLPDELTFVKLGTAGLGPSGLSDWRETRERFDASMTSQAQWIAVAYADWERSAAPAPQGILEAAIAEVPRRCAGLLVDTFVKDGQGLLDCMVIESLHALTVRAQQAGLLVALAGGLSIDDLDSLAKVGPDVVAIRGAACRGADRTAAVERTAVEQFASELERTMRDALR
ncbi:MAG: hypothetical protein CMJ48_12595 [Planctomycetaceae bacterium]|nr:hypothetical protein [Planctomycetaceae bacterium]